MSLETLTAKWVAAAIAGLLAVAPAVAQDRDRPVEKLLQEGWEVVTFTAAQERRTVILFRHKDHKHLVQCSILVDVTRKPSVVSACYEIR